MRILLSICLILVWLKWKVKSTLSNNSTRDIEQRGLGTSRTALDIVNGTLAQKEGKVSEAEEYYKRVMAYGVESFTYLD